MRALPMPIEVETLCVSSYGSSDQPSLELRILKDLERILLAGMS